MGQEGAFCACDLVLKSPTTRPVQVQSCSSRREPQLRCFGGNTLGRKECDFRGALVSGRQRRAWASRESTGSPRACAAGIRRLLRTVPSRTKRPRPHWTSAEVAQTSGTSNAQNGDEGGLPHYLGSFRPGVTAVVPRPGHLGIPGTRSQHKVTSCAQVAMVHGAGTGCRPLQTWPPRTQRSPVEGWTASQRGFGFIV